MTLLETIRGVLHTQLARHDITVLGLIKRGINMHLSRCGHVMTRKDMIPSFDRLVSCLHRADLLPRTVFDIGVAYGTPWLYAAFPGAKFHLVDPSRESQPHMETWAKKIDADVHNVALGPESANQTIATRSTIIHSSLLNSVANSKIKDHYDVAVRRFDALFHDFERPAFCKIDVEGAELMVLQGMGERLRNIDVLVIETSMISLYDKGPEFSDIVDYMNKHRFSFFDVCSMLRRPFDNALHQMDAVFVPEQSPLRVRRWN